MGNQFMFDLLRINGVLFTYKTVAPIRAATVSNLNSILIREDEFTKP
jgi:hypothetical protein